MSSSEQSPGAGRPTEQQRRIARLTGVLWIVTFITSIPAYLLYHPELNHTGFITGTGSETRVLVGSFLELLLIVANIGTAVVPYSIYKRQSEPLALGPGFVVGIGNGLLMGSLAYRSGLVPRRMAMLGLIGGPLIRATGIAVVLGWIDQGGSVQGIATIPEFFWELSLGVYLTVKGFSPSPILDDTRYLGQR